MCILNLELDVWHLLLLDVSPCVTSQVSWCHIDIMTIIAIHCDSLCTNCRFLKTGLVDHIGVLQAPKIHVHFTTVSFLYLCLKWRTNSAGCESTCPECIAKLIATESGRNCPFTDLSTVAFQPIASVPSVTNRFVRQKSTVHMLSVNLLWNQVEVTFRKGYPDNISKLNLAASQWIKELLINEGSYKTHIYSNNKRRTSTHL